MMFNNSQQRLFAPVRRMVQQQNESSSTNKKALLTIAATSTGIAATLIGTKTREQIQYRTVSTLFTGNAVSRYCHKFTTSISTTTTTLRNNSFFRNQLDTTKYYNNYNKNNNNQSILSSLRNNFTSDSTTTTTGKKQSFMEWYERHLAIRPIITKMITGGCLWGIGDCVGQTIPKYAANEELELDKYDIERTVRAIFFGCCIHAPTSHIHYNFLEYITQYSKLTGYSIPIFKAFMEQFVYWSWISNSIYHGAMEILSTYTINPTAIYYRINDVLWETQKAQWIFWIPVQLVNFQFTPVRHQLNVVLITSIVWTALLSAWYPPVKKEKENQKELTIDTSTSSTEENTQKTK